MVRASFLARSPLEQPLVVLLPLRAEEHRVERGQVEGVMEGRLDSRVWPTQVPLCRVLCHHLACAATRRCNTAEEITADDGGRMLPYHGLTTTSPRW